MLDVEQDIIRQIGICLNDEERRRAQGLGLEQDRRRLATQLQGLEGRIARGGLGQYRSRPGSKDDSANAAEHKTDCDPGTQRPSPRG